MLYADVFCCGQRARSSKGDPHFIFCEYSEWLSQELHFFLVLDMPYWLHTISKGQNHLNWYFHQSIPSCLLQFLFIENIAFFFFICHVWFHQKPQVLTAVLLKAVCSKAPYLCTIASVAPPKKVHVRCFSFVWKMKKWFKSVCKSIGQSGSFR